METKKFIADKSFISHLDSVDIAHINFFITILWRTIRRNYSIERRKKNREFLQNSPFIPILAELYGIPEDQMLNYFLLKNEFDTHHH